MRTAPLPAPAPFGALLRGWRTTRRLSQLELALASMVSQRHLSFLESGRARPSRQMVLQLAEALEVPLRERNDLLAAAGFAAHYRERTLDDAAMAPVHEALRRMLEHHEPYPAVVVDRAYDLRLANRAFDALLGLFGAPDALWQACCGDGPRNLLALTFHAAGARPFIRNFDELAPVMLARVQREALAHGGTPPPALAAVLADETLPRHWQQAMPGSLPPPVLPLVLGRDAVELRLFSVISTFGTPCDVTTDEIRVEAFFPADAASETLLATLAGHGE
ncbi:MAG: helix-turn-helix transcriptional regulator [Gammaproteobacteria bacterium]